MLVHERIANLEAGQMPEIADWVSQDSGRFADLMELVFDHGSNLSRKAAWCVSLCAETQPLLAVPYLKALLDNLSHPKLHDAIQRSTVKVLAETPIPENLQGYALNTCFGFLENPKTAVAIQVHSMQTIFNISKGNPDLLRELEVVIKGGMEHGSAGYQNRAKKLLRQIRKILQR